ncbi:MAG: cation:proton antiporter [Bacilli bacterium]|nr:cation:proton antiporter [Bacilli bacterium]
METGEILLEISIALIAGLISNRLIKLINLPNVTGYLIVGILLGPYFFSLFNENLTGVISKEMVESFGIIVDIALGFIAFSIGSEFKLSSIKKLGKGIITITLIQAFAALLFVDIALSVLSLCTGSFNENLPLILTLGAVATATAPAATLMVIKQYKAKGPVTDTLLPVVAMDDAVGLILFSISFSIAQVFAKQQAGIGGAEINVISILLMPILEIVLSLVIGSIIGIILSFAMRFFKSRANRLICMIAATFLAVALCELCGTWFGFELSSLLTCMMVGAIFCNTRKDAIQIFDGIERWTPAIFMMFFILSGAELNFKLITLPVIGICAVYVIARSLGKYFGARYGCRLSHTNENVKKFLGLTLLPQAGVAIGMARSSSNVFNGLADAALLENPLFTGGAYLQNIAGTITAVVLCATLVYELVGPLITKVALTKANEIQGKSK